MSYSEYKLSLSEGQLESLKRAKRNQEEVTIRLYNKDLSGSHSVQLTDRQIDRIKKAKANGVGVEITFSKTQMKKQAIGGNLAAMLPAIAEAGKAVQGTFQKGIDAVDNQLERGFQKNMMTGKYDRVNARNERAVTRKDDAALAKRFNYIKKEFVKERGLNWDDNKIWDFVMSGGDLSGIGQGLFTHGNSGRGLTLHGGGKKKR